MKIIKISSDYNSRDYPDYYLELHDGDDVVVIELPLENETSSGIDAVKKFADKKYVEV